MSNRHLLIEFIGLPGAGKSTISKQVREELKDSDIIFDNLIGIECPLSRLNRSIWKIKYIVKEIVLHPAFNLKQINLILRSKQETFMDFIIVTTNWIIMMGQWRKGKKTGKNIISDQGIVQAVWSVFLSAKEDMCIEEFLDQVDLPDIVFYIKIDREIMKLRLTKRNSGQSRMERKNNFNDEEIYLKSIEIFKQIKKYLNKRNVSLTIIDNNGSDALFENKEIIKYKIINSYNGQ